ncbi:MAG: class II aldolase/adducin family protein [Pseudomonadales bacterium]|nr:class II aldolase/adducin family protein [Pseudomonadales bacterium]NIX09665.1 class II aldolase/adducin family protein [Pseudomonadales bacterium]
MAEQEGVIHFAYDLQTPDGAVTEETLRDTLAAWRTIFRRLGVLGHDPERYGGFGFGNLSVRDPERPDEFVVTASQTSGQGGLRDRDLVRISGCNLERFWVDAVGHKPPSSETLTHAMIYAADPRIRWVFHVHSPEIWEHAEPLAIPCTAQEVAYGSPEMVRAVAELLEKHQSRPLLFATFGHVDGVFACGPTARDAGGLLVSYLAKALA